MRAMEYTPVQCRCEMVDRWVIVRWCPIHGTQIEPTKKLTDAECAAEYWQAEAEHTGMRNGEGVGWSSAEVMAALEREVEVWHRFANHPHASEVEA